MGDPDFVSVPLDGLLSKDFAAERRCLIGPTAATSPVAPGDPFPPFTTSCTADSASAPSGQEGTSTNHLTVVDREGNVRAAVIDFGGFLGVGSRKIVVDWGALRFWRVANKRDSITLELTKAQVAAAPEYKEDAPVIVLGAAGRLQPWDFDH